MMIMHGRAQLLDSLTDVSMHGQEIGGSVAEGNLLHVARYNLPYNSFHLSPFHIITRRPSLDWEVGIDVECQEPRRCKMANSIRKEGE